MEFFFLLSFHTYQKQQQQQKRLKEGKNDERISFFFIIFWVFVEEKKEKYDWLLKITIFMLYDMCVDARSIKWWEKVWEILTLIRWWSFFFFFEGLWCVFTGFYRVIGGWDTCTLKTKLIQMIKCFNVKLKVLWRFLKVFKSLESFLKVFNSILKVSEDF